MDGVGRVVTGSGSGGGDERRRRTMKKLVILAIVIGLVAVCVKMCLGEDGMHATMMTKMRKRGGDDEEPKAT